MLSKKLPLCASMSIISKFTIPTTIGTVVTLLVKAPKIIETANKVKKEIPNVKQLLDNIKPKNQPATEEVEESMG